jgi:6-phosphogluconolactonase (cycloisomerase 2 family)
MPSILTGLPASILPGVVSGPITLSPSQLISQMGITGHFSNSANWDNVTFIYTDSTFVEPFGMNFPIGTLTSNFYVDATAIQNTWLCEIIVIYDLQGGEYILRRSTSALAQFDVLVGAIPTYEFVYTANYRDNDLSMYSLNKISGQLTALSPATVGSGNGPITVVTHPSGKFAYCTNNTDNTVSMYSINQTTGKLTALSPATIATQSQPSGITVHPSGNWLYVMNQASTTVEMYSINTGTGQLTSLGTIATGGAFPQFMVITPSGQFAYVVNAAGGDVAQYSIDLGTGLLTVLGGSPIPAGSLPGQPAIDTTGSFLYVPITDPAWHAIVQFDLNPSTGQMNYIVNTVNSGARPYQIVVTPDNKYAYVADFSGGFITMYAITAGTGYLTPLSPVTIPAGSLSFHLTIDTSGKFLYCINYNDNTINMYSINSTNGQLTALSPATIGTGAGPYGITSVQT